jgi:ribosomal protein L11 methyltransferase
VWHLHAQVRGTGAAEGVISILDGLAGAVSAFEAAAGAEWQIDAYASVRQLTPELAARLALAAAAAGGSVVSFSEDRLAERDWLAENQLAFPPLRAGRFFIHGSHHRHRVPAGMIGIRVDAATAFGTGEHPSTLGCLAALQFLAGRRRFRRPLDIGTGTGILAIAAAKLLRRPVQAGDIDPDAVAVARHNVAANGVAGLVRVARAPGYRGLPGRDYDLVLANILARPLARLARDLGRHLADDGRAVLSGLLLRQEPVVLAAHRACGMVLERRFAIRGWSTLVLRRR